MTEKPAIESAVVVGQSLSEWIELICDDQSAFHTALPPNLRRLLYLVIDRRAAAMLIQIDPDQRD